MVTLAVTGLLVLSAAARADFSVAPTVIDVGRAPGQVAVGTFSVRLQGERGRRFVLAIEDVGQDRSGAFKFRSPGGSRFSASRWLALSPRAFTGSADREQLVEFRARVPRDAEPGDHVTSITVKRLAAANAGSAAIVQAVAVRLTIRVTGAARPAVELRDLSAPAFAGGGPVNAKVTVRNSGNVRLNFDGANRGALAALSGDHTKARQGFTGVLYPGETRDFRLVWQDPPALGHFTIRAAVQAAAEDRAATDTAVWVVPWRQALALALIVFAAVVVLGGRRRRRSPS